LTQSGGELKKNEGATRVNLFSQRRQYSKPVLLEQKGSRCGKRGVTYQVKEEGFQEDAILFGQKLNTFTKPKNPPFIGRLPRVWEKDKRAWVQGVFPGPL